MLVRMCYCNSVPHKAFHHEPPATVESRTVVPSIPVAPTKSEGYCECRGAGSEVEDGLCECGHGDYEHYSNGRCGAWCGIE
jgi:hypothetical protein